MTAVLRAWHGDAAFKARTIATAGAHRAADLLRHGATGSPDEGRPGCSVACTVGTYEHDLYPERLGLPEWLAHLQDAIYEALPRDDRHLDDEWTVDLLGAIEPGADIDAVQAPILRDVLAEVALPVAGSSAGVVQAVIDLLGRRIGGDEPTPDEWAAARAAARAAQAARAAWTAAETAWAARAARATWTAWAAARAAETTAETAGAAAETAAWERIRAIILHHVAAAPATPATA